MSIAENIKTLRKEKGITQKQLAEKTGLAVITIQGYESGKYNPKINTIMNLCAALDCSVIDIIGEEGKQYYRMFDIEQRLSDVSNEVTKNDVIQLVKPNITAFRSMVKELLPDLYPDILSKFDTNTSEGRKAARFEIMKLLAAYDELPVLYFDNSEYSTEELQKIKEYAEFIKSQRKN